MGSILYILGKHSTVSMYIFFWMEFKYSYQRANLREPDLKREMYFNLSETFVTIVFNKLKQ